MFPTIDWSVAKYRIQQRPVFIHLTVSIRRDKFGTEQYYAIMEKRHEQQLCKFVRWNVESARLIELESIEHHKNIKVAI